jgi:predicted nucleic acid-binding protein
LIHLLDTNVFMHLANEAPGHRNIERHIEVAGAASLRASAITLAELRSKAASSSPSCLLKISPL